MRIAVVTFEPKHLAPARALWNNTEGVGLSDADNEDKLLSYLARNPRTSFVAMRGTTLVGTVLCGHDGRRGLIHHLAVAAEHRRKGLGRALLSAGLAALNAEGIAKCHLLVFGHNESGLAFWSAAGAQLRGELRLLSLPTQSAA